MVNCGCEQAELESLVGRRLAVGDSVGTVRYVGPVPPAKGTMLGVEWDDPSRGKHNGSYKGQQYFCTRHPTAGSFIHLEKADFGRSFVSAIKERYGSNQLTLTADELQDLQRAMNAPSLEMVGFEKISQKQSCYSALETICLHNQLVVCAGEGLVMMCPKTREVDLSSNLFISWEEVAEITVNFPRLHFLNLSYNRISIPEEPSKLEHAFRHLSHIVLAHMDYSWDQIVACSAMWPQIQHLQVPFNKVTAINLPEDTLVNLTDLDLESNSISKWEEINKLGHLEHLDSLNLCNMGLTTVSIPASKNLFKNLQCLMLSDNKIDKWESISELDKLSSLSELKFASNPVLNGLSIAAIYHKIIARVGSLKILNRKIITREERRSAEIDYIKEYGKEWLDSAKDKELRAKFLSSHPRYPSLVKKYGALEESEVVDKLQDNPSNMLRLTIRSENETITKTIPKTMVINRFIILIKRLFKKPSGQPVLTYHSLRNPKIRLEMQNLFHTLDYYSVEDGDEIVVRWD